MAHGETFRDDRRAINPAFNRRKLKLGTFQSNLDYGCLMADVEGRLKISWPNTVALARLADAMEFEALGAGCALARLRRQAQSARSGL